MRTIPLSNHTAAELALGRPSWRSYIVSVAHEHVNSEGRGFVEVVSRAGRGVPVFLGSIVGPQLLTLDFTLRPSNGSANAERR